MRLFSSLVTKGRASTVSSNRVLGIRDPRTKKFMKSGTTIQPGGGYTTNREPDDHNSGGDGHQRPDIGSSERPRSLPSHAIDPFAVKVSIPPLVLLAYVLWKQYYRDDPRLESARRAEAMHIQYLADLEDQKRASEFASKM